VPPHPATVLIESSHALVLGYAFAGRGWVLGELRAGDAVVTAKPDF
jgi:hypothetical protein